MNPPPDLTLAIESAISGGSLSLLRGTTEIAHWIGSGTVAKAEEQLENIDQLLRINHLTPENIDLVAVSAGPGSFTGIRIGIATALGLKNGLGIRMSGISVLRAMAIASKDVEREEITVAVPVGRDRVCFQSFRKTLGSLIESWEPETISGEEFDRDLRQETQHGFVLHRILCEGDSIVPNVTVFGDNLAYAVGLACQMEAAAMPHPLFVSRGIG